MNIVQSRDLDILFKSLLKMTPIERRGWYVRIRIQQACKTVREIAKRHRITRHHLSDAIRGHNAAGGPVPWSPRICRILANDLNINLAPFLTEKEAARLH